MYLSVLYNLNAVAVYPSLAAILSPYAPDRTVAAVSY